VKNFKCHCLQPLLPYSPFHFYLKQVWGSLGTLYIYYILLKKYIWTVGPCTRCSQQSGRGCSWRFQNLPDCSKKTRGVLQHVQANIFHYNTIGLHVVSIEIWPSTDSMYFEHYLCVLAAATIIWKTAINYPSIHYTKHRQWSQHKVATATCVNILSFILLKFMTSPLFSFSFSNSPLQV